MARPSKPIALCTGARTNDEIQQRVENEKKLKGKNDKLKPPTYMSKNAKKFFKFIIKESEEADIFGNVDVFVLEQFSNTYARYRELEEAYNKEKDFEIKEKLENRIKKQADQLPRLYNELGLSPGTRSKLGAINLSKQQEEQDPLLTILKKREERMAK